MFNSAKGYGFIKRDDRGGPDLFAHFNDFDSDPELGQRVSFVVTETDRGARAVSIEAVVDDDGR